MAGTYDDGRKAYICRPKVEQPEKKPYRMPRVGKKRRRENYEAKDVTKTFLHYNPICACGCGEPATCPQHIASGSSGRAATLHDTDLHLPSSEWCNGDAVWHDPLLWPKARQLARKFTLTLGKFNAANAIPTTLEEVVSYLDVDWDRVQEIIRKRNGG